MKVVLSAVSEVARALEMIRVVKPDVIHLGGEPWSVDQILQLKVSEPSVKIMQAIPINTGEPIRMACQYQSICDYLLLDTNDPKAIDVGATGMTHDWNISAQLVREVHVPVIMAGGLSPTNVADAVRRVRPWGVDSFSHTNFPGRPARKDPEKVRAFIFHAVKAVS